LWGCPRFRALEPGSCFRTRTKSSATDCLCIEVLTTEFVHSRLPTEAPFPISYLTYLYYLVILFVGGGKFSVPPSFPIRNRLESTHSACSAFCRSSSLALASLFPRSYPTLDPLSPIIATLSQKQRGCRASRSTSPTPHMVLLAEFFHYLTSLLRCVAFFATRLVALPSNLSEAKGLIALAPLCSKFRNEET